MCGPGLTDVLGFLSIFFTVGVQQNVLSKGKVGGSAILVVFCLFVCCHFLVGWRMEVLQLIPIET